MWTNGFQIIIVIHFFHLQMNAACIDGIVVVTAVVIRSERTNDCSWHLIDIDIMRFNQRKIRLHVHTNNHQLTGAQHLHLPVRWLGLCLLFLRVCVYAIFIFTYNGWETEIISFDCSNHKAYTDNNNSEPRTKFDQSKHYMKSVWARTRQKRTQRKSDKFEEKHSEWNDDVQWVDNFDMAYEPCSW